LTGKKIQEKRKELPFLGEKEIGESRDLQDRRGKGNRREATHENKGRKRKGPNQRPGGGHKFRKTKLLFQKPFGTGGLRTGG